MLHYCDLIKVVDEGLEVYIVYARDNSLIASWGGGGCSNKHDNKTTSTLYTELPTRYPHNYVIHENVNACLMDYGDIGYKKIKSTQWSILNVIKFIHIILCWCSFLD